MICEVHVFKRSGHWLWQYAVIHGKGNRQTVQITNLLFHWHWHTNTHTHFTTKIHHKLVYTDLDTITKVTLNYNSFSFLCFLIFFSESKLKYIQGKSSFESALLVQTRVWKKRWKQLIISDPFKSEKRYSRVLCL